MLDMTRCLHLHVHCLHDERCVRRHDTQILDASIVQILSARPHSQERLCSGAFLFVYELHIPYGSCWLVNSDRELWKFSQRTLGTGLSRLCAACTEIDSVGSKPYGCDAFNRLSCCLYICCKQKAVHAPRKRNGYRGRERTSYVGHSYQRYLSAKTWLDQ